ncbi:hypothetical protein SAMN05421752_1067 [Natronorubrum thiooxidans]|uniref:DUF8173 domain-containing protein n=2 Tax=Natronorubrum thiooxidans TaxID=308853 RepID=A0A1N7F5Y9_9EURY|nr:hypothetical protein SAMN05421752_1067 [Natronorubrum thiooxidans]
MGPTVVATTSSDGVLAVAVSDVARALGVAAGWTLLTLVVGGLVIARFPSSTRAIRDDITAQLDRVFPVGFVVFFGLLVVVSVPLFAMTILEHPALLAVGAVVSLPGLVLWAILLVVGGCFGGIAVGNWLVSRFGRESPSLWLALVIGTVVIASSQLVPVLGTVVVLGVATVGIGAVVRRRFDIGSDDEHHDRAGNGFKDGSTADSATADGSSVEWETDNAVDSEIWRSNEHDATANELESTTATPSDRGLETARDSSMEWNGQAGGEARWRDEATTDEWDVDDWEWEIDTDRECDSNE